jgi:hypothetical protein
MACLLLLASFLLGLDFCLEDGGEIFFRKRRLTFNGPYRVTFHKLELFVTAWEKPVLCGNVAA